MAWLTSLLKKPESVEEEPVLLEAPEPVATGPQLAVLVPDNAGISSFRLRMLPAATTAEEHIAGLRAEVRHDTHAFWALHDKPIVDENGQVEALVLIRAQAESDLVYVVSFLDIESALSFTRFEVRRGLYLGNVMIYWAAFAQVREELEGVTIVPQYAPPTVNYIPPAVAQIAGEPEQRPAPEASIAVSEPEIEPEVVTTPRVETPVEAEAREAVERYLAKHAQREPAPKIEDSTAVAEPPVIERPQMPKPAEPPVIDETAPDFDDRTISLAPEFASHHPELEELPEASIDLAPPVRTSPTAETGPETLVVFVPKPEPEPEPEATLSSPVAEEQAAIDEALVFQHRTIELAPMKPRTVLEAEGASEGMLIDAEPEGLSGFVEVFSGDEETADSITSGIAVAEPEPSVETFPGDEETEARASASADPAAGLPESPRMDDFDIAFEVERLLRNRRWEQKDSPFNGFKSPPGRF